MCVVVLSSLLLVVFDSMMCLGCLMSYSCVLGCLLSPTIFKDVN